MAAKKSQANEKREEMIPFMQQILDNPFILLALGVALPGILYLVWGIIEVTQIPIAN